jgi:hypothetical protein
MRRKSNVTTSKPREAASNYRTDLQNSPNWLNPTKRSLRWLGLPPIRISNGIKSQNARIDDQAA